MIVLEAISRAKKDIGISSDDATVGSRYVYSILKSVRSELLRQEIEKKGIWPGFPMQTLRSFELKFIDLAEIDEFDIGLFAYKSVLPLPELMDTKEGKIFGGVFLPSLDRINSTTFTQWLNKRKRRYRSILYSSFFRDRHVYIVDYPRISDTLFINVDGVFENPEEVEKLNNEQCNKEQTCVFYPDLDFHLPAYLEGRFFRIVRQELAISLGIPLDNTNNAKADIQQTAQIQKQNVQDTG